jgi:hypothetical protein
MLYSGGFGSMGNTHAGCGRDLPTILRISRNDPKSRSVNNFQMAGFGPKQEKQNSLPAEAPPR